MRSIVRRDTGASYEEFLRGWRRPRDRDTDARRLGALDRKRKKRTSNKEWKSPADGDARIAKMKDGRTHLAHKAEHAVDLDTGAVLAVTLQGADRGDTATLDETLCEVGMAVAEQVGREAELRPHEAPKVNVAGIEETVTDKGYHSGAVEADEGVRGAQLYSGEETRGGGTGRAKRRSNKRCTRTAAGAGRVRQEFYCGGAASWSSAAFAHCYETGGMRRCNLRGHENILKRQLIHVGAFNLSLILRQLLGAGTPREWRTASADLF